MPAPASVDDLLKLIRKSGMLDEPRLDAYVERLRLSGPVPTDVRKLAGRMVKVFVALAPLSDGMVSGKVSAVPR